MERGLEPPSPSRGKLWIYPRNWVVDRYSDVRERVVVNVDLNMNLKSDMGTEMGGREDGVKT